MTARMSLAIVGCGDIARFTALFARLDRRIRLMACCDPVLANAERLAATFRIPNVHSDYQTMLENEKDVDAIYLAVPHDLHLDMARAAIESERHVLIEKPIARTLQEGQSLVELAQTTSVCVGVNYQYRYDRGCHALAMAARRGDLGRLYYGRCNIPWHREQGYFDHGAWRGQMKRSGGGTLITQGSHGLDVLLWALESPPRTAVGTTAQCRFTEVDVENLALATVELKNGALAQISSSMIARPEQAVTVEVYGEKGTAIYRSRPFPHVRFRGTRVRKAPPPSAGVHALQRSLGAFCAWVTGGHPYLVPAAEALPVLATVEAIYRSARSGQREEIRLP